MSESIPTPNYVPSLEQLTEACNILSERIGLYLQIVIIIINQVVNGKDELCVVIPLAMNEVTKLKYQILLLQVKIGQLYPDRTEQKMQILTRTLSYLLSIIKSYPQPDT
jgi:hypothetical protein